MFSAPHLLFTSQSLALAPIAFDAVGTPAFSNSSPVSTVDNIPADCDYAVLWYISTNNYNASVSVAATMGGVSMTQQANYKFWSYGIAYDYYVACLTLANPPTGSQTVSLTTNAIIGGSFTVAYYKNVGSCGSPVTSNGVSGNCSLNVSSSVANRLYSQAFVNVASTGQGFVNNYNRTNRYENDGLLIGDANGNGGTLSFTVSRDETTNGWAGMALPLIL